MDCESFVSLAATVKASVVHTTGDQRVESLEVSDSDSDTLQTSEFKRVSLFS